MRTARRKLISDSESENMTETHADEHLNILSPESGKMEEYLKEKHKEWVIAAIDQIRQRKARPDLQRLCSSLHRKHGLSKSKIQSIIEQLVAENIIFKVVYKGQCSFRHAKSYIKSDSMNNLSTSSRIVQAIRAIMKQTGDGVSFIDLQNWLLGKNPDTRLVKNRLELALKRELEANTVTKLSDNCYVLTESLPTKEKKEEKPVVPTTSPNNKSLPPTEKSDCGINSVVVRKSGRPKKKKNEDPDYEVPNCIKGSRPEKIVCDFCSKPAENKEGKKFLLICKDCKAKAHPSCMDYSEELAVKARNSPWQCMDCKVCYVCEGSGDANCMLFCDSCDKGYHMACHNPPVSNKPKGKWVCGQCKIEKKSPPSVKETKETNVSESPFGKKAPSQFSKIVEGSDQEPPEVDLSVSRRGRKRKLNQNFGDFVGFKQRKSTTSSLDQSIKETIGEESQINGFTDGTEGASCLPTPSASPTLGDTFDYQLKMSESVIPLHINDNATYPNASKWSIDQVVQYFTELGFISEAKAFKEQEIDGRSLLLMKRNDVLTGLAIKLGPALKIYQKVYKLQTVGQISS